MDRHRHADPRPAEQDRGDEQQHHTQGDEQVLSDDALRRAAARPYLRALQAAGASILLHTDGMLHAKVVLADADLAVRGTANMGMRSLLLNYEIAAFVYSRPEIEAIQAWVEGIAAQGQRGMAPASASGELGEGFARIFAPLL